MNRRHLWEDLITSIDLRCIYIKQFNSRNKKIEKMNSEDQLKEIQAPKGQQDLFEQLLYSSESNMDQNNSRFVENYSIDPLEIFEENPYKKDQAQVLGPSHDSQNTQINSNSAKGNTKFNKKQKKQGKKRSRDQNLCKKYHYAGLRVLKKLRIQQKMKTLKNKIPNLQYFPVLLTVANKNKLLDKFEVEYKKQIALVEEKEFSKDNFEHLKDSIKKSIESIQIFREEGAKASCQHLFSEKMKNRSTYPKTINKFMNLLEDLFRENQTNL